MKELLKVIKFNCELERFAEVFGDCIESEDVTEFLKVAPLTPEELEKARKSDLFYSVGTPNGEFEALDLATQTKLNILRESARLEPKDLFLCRAFFRFVNDAYKWDDFEDLERWEEELFDSLNGYQQKNYEPLELGEDAESRAKLFYKFVYYLETCKGSQTAKDCINLVLNDLDPLSKFYACFVSLEAQSEYIGGL